MVVLDISWSFLRSLIKVLVSIIFSNYGSDFCCCFGGKCCSQMPQYLSAIFTSNTVCTNGSVGGVFLNYYGRLIVLMRANRGRFYSSKEHLPITPHSKIGAALTAL